MKIRLVGQSLLLLSLAFNAGAQPGFEPAQSLGKKQAASWYDGMIKYSIVNNCIVGSVEYGVGAYVGFYAEPDVGLPAPNATYYVHVVVSGVGNPCSGTRAYVEIVLPANTSLAINQTNKVLYYLDGNLLAANESPQSLPASTYNAGAFALLSTDNAHANTWPVAQGHTFEFQIPVVSSTTLSGGTLQANIWAIDGYSSPWLSPQEGVYVFSSTPSILYSAPSTVSITTTTAHSQVTLYTGGTFGTGYFDLGKTTAYGLAHDPVTIAAGTASYTVWDDWGPPPLTPGTMYHWRFTYTTSSGTTYTGEDQTFTTLPGSSAVAGSLPQVINSSSGKAFTYFDMLGRSIQPSMFLGTAVQKHSTGLLFRKGLHIGGAEKVLKAR